MKTRFADEQIIQMIKEQESAEKAAGAFKLFPETRCLGIGPALIQKNQACRIEVQPTVKPGFAGGPHIRLALLTSRLIHEVVKRSANTSCLGVQKLSASYAVEQTILEAPG